MSRINKLERFAANAQAVNVIEQGKDIYTQIKGNWRKDYFKNNHEIVVELGCGTGAYTLGLAEQYPDKNFIGVDIKGSRIWQGSQQALEDKIENVAFLRCQILYIQEFFEKGEIDEIWVTFPDPRMKDRDERKRLISPRFLALYKGFLKDNGIVNLKTDDQPLYEYSDNLVKEMNLDIIASTNDLYNSEHLKLTHGIQTTYEKRFLAEGKPITYLRFQLK